MTNHVLLDNVAHADLRVALRYGADVGDAINQVLIFPTEFEQVQREYPIMIRRNEAGAFYAVALLGFESSENLFLDGERWDAKYVPAIRQRGPFVTPARSNGNADEGRPSVEIDLDDPRTGAPGGEPLFLRHGGHTPYLRHMTNVLEAVKEGHRSMTPVFNAFSDAGLLRPTTINIELGDGQTVLVDDVHVVTRASLAELEPDALAPLSQSGLLYLAYMAAASLETMNYLIARKQQRRSVVL